MGTSKKSGFLKWFVLLVVFGGTAYGGYRYWKNREDEPVSYQTVKVVRGDVTQAVTANGTLNPVLNVQVGSQISGNIQKLNVDYNSSVKAGQVVGQIDPAIYNASVMQAEGDLASAEAALELTRINAKRAEELRATNAVPQSNLDQAMANLHQAEAALKQKQGALAKAKVDLEHCTIYSPIDGVVISRSVDVGQTVAASLSAPVIFTIANDLTKMQIDANVGEADVGNVVVGQDVDFIVDAYPTTFHGKVIQVRNAPITVQQVVTYDTVIGVSNPELKLKPGMTATVSIIVAHAEGVLKIANAALRFRPPEAAPAERATPEVATGDRTKRKRRAPDKGDSKPERTVYVLAGAEETGTPEPVKIKTGITDNIYTEIIEGLKEGDRVITGSTGGKSAPAPAANPFGGGSSFRRF